MKTTHAPERRPIEVSIKLDPETVARLDEQAQQAGITRAALVRLLIECMSEEDIEDLALGLEAKRRLEDPAEERIPWEQVKQELGL